MRAPRWWLLVTLFTTFISLGALGDDKDVAVSKPTGAPPGMWVKIGVVTATHNADHDRITVVGPHDDFRRLKFSVRHSPLTMKRIVVTYDRGDAERLDTRDDIPKNGETRSIDLKGANKRSLRSIDFWYETKGMLNGKAEVTAWGQK